MAVINTDLVILDANPLADIANVARIHVVVANGRAYDAAQRQAMIDGARRAARGVRATAGDAPQWLAPPASCSLACGACKGVVDDGATGPGLALPAAPALAGLAALSSPSSLVMPA